MIYIKSLDQAKQYAGVTWPNGDPRDQELLDQIAIAEAVVADYLGVRDTPEQYTNNLIVQGATLRQLLDQWRWRGDDPETVSDSALDRPADGYLSPLVTSMLHRLRKQVLA
jgi:hypothetical protein